MSALRQSLPRTLRARWRVIVLLFASSALALSQSQPNFSGVFLGLPLQGMPLLEINQSADTLVMTSSENGESATKAYRLDGTPTMNSYIGVLTKDVVHFKKGTLRIDSTILVAPRAPNLGLGYGWGYSHTSPTSVSETWELSPDIQVLKVKRKVRFKGNSLDNVEAMETFHRESSKEAALKDARAYASPDKCNLPTAQV